MSSETVNISPATASALVMAAALAAAERTVTRIAEYDAQLDRAVRARARGEIDEHIWPRTAAHVVELNARIGLFEARARHAGVRMLIPARLPLAGSDPWRAAAWCVRTAERLRGAQYDLSESTARQQPSNALRERFRALLYARYRSDLTAALPPVSVLEADMQVALHSVDPDADDAEHTRTLASAARVAEHAARPAEARPYLLELTFTVNQINTAAARRRLAAQWLLALEDPGVAGLTSWPGYDRTVARLRAVVVGAEALGACLRAETKDAMIRAEEAVRRNVPG